MPSFVASKNEDVAIRPRNYFDARYLFHIISRRFKDGFNFTSLAEINNGYVGKWAGYD